MSESKQTRAAREAALYDAFDERILVMDGATGTGFQARNLTADDFGGADLEGCNENLVITRPDVVLDLHRDYLKVGADVIETNTFGGASIVLAEYDLQDQAIEINRRAAAIAREACAEFDAPGRLRFVCGSMGPTTKAISVTGGVTFEELRASYRDQAIGLMEGGADYLLLETCQDTRNIKAGLLGIEDAAAATGITLPVAVSATIETMGTMLAGQDAEAYAISLLHPRLLYLGLNCGSGPDLMTDHLRTVSELARTRVACVPNAGLPNEDGLYSQDAEHLAGILARFADEGWLNLVGGCCGTTPTHIEALAGMVQERTPRTSSIHQRTLLSGMEAVELTNDNRPLLVGERTNVLGSRKFKRLIEAGDFEGAAEVGRAQVRTGAQIVDICMQNPDRDEMDDVERFLDRIVRMVRVPFMIDSTDHAVMERALTYCQGKSILNSINLEDGPERFDQVVPLAKTYGASLVVGLIDEDPDQGMAVTVDRKREVAARSYELLTEEYGIPPEDILWDALVFPCGTGDAQYIGSAGATIEGVRMLKGEFPLTKTILGISNVSFGLPPAGREVLNAVFLHHATRAGLDAAIVNTERLARYAEIPEEERRLAESLIFLDPGDEAGSKAAIEAFALHFRGRKREASTPRESLPLEDRIARAIVEGSKVGLTEDLDAALSDGRWKGPLAIINGPLMKGMAEVGRLFASNQLIVAEVLQSAEAMKAAVSHLEPHMDRSEDATRGRILLATVKGDVHDIGKNLVDIILSNNGFKVINLGIKIPSERILQAVREHKPDVIGLSGLLVKSAQQMVLTAGDLRAQGVTTPLLVGGAALSRRFTHKKIAAAYDGICTYAEDAMTGLRLVERLTNDGERATLAAEVAAAVAEDREAAQESRDDKGEAGTTPSTLVDRTIPPPSVPDLDRHIDNLDLDEVWSLLSEQMLYGKHLGVRGGVERLASRNDPKLAELKRLIKSLQEEWRREGLAARAVRRFYRAVTDGNRLTLLDAGGVEAGHWDLPRKSGPDGLCLADYVLPENDHVALFVTTAGSRIRERVEAYKQQGEYLRSHALAAMALETAEAAAELVHRKIRAEWGFSDPASLTKKETLAARYRGKRYSFGYPACPDLGGQQLLFELLDPKEIGVALTEGDMMDPEASVSALVFHHPDARYFSV